MSENRQTQIIEEEIEDFDDTISLKRDEIFEQFKLALLDTDSTRLLGKFYNYCDQYVNFEFDESAMNMDEADDVLRKVNILRDKLLISLEQSLNYTFENVKTDTKNFQISFILTLEDVKYKIILEVFEDSFDLEIV